MQIRDAAVEDAPAYRALRYQIDSESDTWGADPDERFKMAMHPLKNVFGVFGRVLILLAMSQAATSKAEQNPVKVGMLLTLSGNYASAGADCQKGIEAALSMVPQQSRFEAVYGDSKADPTTAVGEFRRLTDSDGVVAVYTHRSNIGMTLDPVSEKSGVPLLGAAGNQNFAKNNKFAFQIWPKSDEEGEFVANEILKRGHKRVALLSTQDEWTTAIADSFRKRIVASGGTIVFDQAFLPAETDFRTPITQLKSKSPDAIFVDTLLPQIGPIVKQARNLNLPGSLFSNFYTTKKDVLDSAGAAALEGVRFVDVDTDLPALKKKLSPDANVSPPGLTVASYLATLLIAQTLSDNPKIKTRDELYSSLLHQSEIKTPDGNFSVVDRCVKIPMVVKIMRDGKPTNEKTEG